MAIKKCFCGFNPADAEPNAEGRYFCPWCGREFEKSDVEEGKPTPEPETKPEAVVEPSEPETPEPEPETKPEPEAPEAAIETPVETEAEPETPEEEKGGG